MGHITIRLGNAWSTLECDRQELELLNTELSVEDPGAFWAKQRRPGWDGFWYFVDMVNGKFPTGLADRIKEMRPIDCDMVDARVRPPTVPFNPSILKDILLAEHQQLSTRKILEKGIGTVATSVGCHARGQGIMLSDGSTTKVEDIQVGDLLMGPNGSPRTVLKLIRGSGQLHRINPVKGDPFIVNSEHILTLVRTRLGRQWESQNEFIADIVLSDFMKMPSWKRANYKLFRSSVESFSRPEVYLPIDPYFLGILIGDGDISREPRVTTMDPEIVHTTHHQAGMRDLSVFLDKGVNSGKASTYRITTGRSPERDALGHYMHSNILINELRSLGLMGLTSGDKFIPDVYKYSSIENRKGILAGLIDTDGHAVLGGCDYISKSERLARDVAFISRSLGLAAYVKPCQKFDQNGHGGTYYRVSISGDMSIIPCLVQRKKSAKRLQKKNVLRTGFEIESLGEGDYYGFTLDGDGRYLLDDFTVTHNSGKTEQGIAIACHVHGLCVWLTHRRDLMHQTAERILWRTGSEAAKIGDGVWDDVSAKTKFLVGMPQSILKDIETFRWQTKDANILIVDECHTASAANDWYNVSLQVPSYYRVGLTGTPDIGDPVRERRLESATGKVVVRIRAGELAKIGWVAPAKVFFHKVHNQSVYGLTYMDARRVLIEENPERNAMIIELALKEAKMGKRCLIICDTVKHAKIIAEVLAGESVRSKFLYGGNSSASRNEAKKDFKSGALEVVITTPIWDLGVDIPEIETVILAAGGKSAVRVIQRCGRALRTSKGKTLATIHDFFDTGSRYTMRHSEARMKACRDEGFEIAGEIRPKPTTAPR